MKIKNTYIWLTIWISAGLFSADTFLYAQESTMVKLKNVELLIAREEIDSSLIILNTLLKDTLNLNKTSKAELYYLFSKAYEFRNKEEIEFYYNKKAEPLFRALNNTDRLFSILYARFELLINQADLSAKIEAKIYLDEFYKIALKKNTSTLLIKAYKGFARLKVNPIEYLEAMQFYDKAIAEAMLISDTLAHAGILNNKGLIISYYLNKQDSARQFYHKALKLFKKINNSDAFFTTSVNIGLSYIRENRLNRALRWYLKAEAIPLKKYKNNSKRLLYAHMSNTYEELKDYKNALNYVWLYNDYKDSVDIKAQNIAISDIQIKYKSLEKEKENIELIARNRRNRMYSIGALGTLSFLLIFSYLAYRNLDKKKEIAEKNRALARQKVVSLIKDQELLSIDAMVEGQEKERIKIAEDLHDNLGSTLATLKLHFDNYKENLSVGNEKQLEMLANTEHILNMAYAKIRTMAHTNHAGVLAENSLVEAVKSLAHNVSSANKTKIEVIDFGFENSLNHTIEITIFRIVQELITNIIKHAKAKRGTINLTLFETTLGLIVEDDGIGFNTDNLNTKVGGIGLNSIKNRIEKKWNGTFAIDTNLGAGTSILIDIPIKNEI